MKSFLQDTIFGSPNSSPATKSQGNVSTRKKTPSFRGKITGEDTTASESRELENLKNELKIKDSSIAALTAKIERMEDEMASKSVAPTIQRRYHPVTNTANVIDDTGRQRVKMGTRGSVVTTNILQSLSEPQKSPAQLIAEKFLKVFQNPVEYMSYLQSTAFASDLTEVCHAISDILESEPRCLFMQSPVYVFGDIHGNLEDLHFFADNIWKMGMDLTAGQFLFLGDYVDRGMSCLECVAYLFGLKILYPKKIHLLRGNHETRDVNGWEEHYQEKSFLYQCKDRFGPEIGESVWEECNQSFDRLPLAGVIDHEIFCIHGGFPRPVPGHHKTEIQAILAIPHLVAIMPAYDHENEWMKQVATDCIWSDPASEEMEAHLDEDSGFGESPRGGGAVCFGSRAIDNFLETNNLSYIIRAHEAHAHGVALSKGARVFTVFSTSKDHRQGVRAMAGCILVDNDKIQVINRSHKYKNKYVHRRTSVSMEHLSSEEMDERQRLGLVRDSVGGVPAPAPASYEEDDQEESDTNEVYFTSGVSYKPGF